jgi:hypothetical protein
MTLLATNIHTLVDVATRMDPSGKAAQIAELLKTSNPILEDMSWKEGNLTTGERTAIRTGLPSVAFRQINAGVPKSKSTVAAVDEGAAELVGQSQVDRELAILSGNPAAYRMQEAATFFEAMNQAMATTLFYGNAAASPKEFTGLAPRFNSKSGFNAGQIIDAGGTGSDNRSIWIIAWGEHPAGGRRLPHRRLRPRRQFERLSGLQGPLQVELRPERQGLPLHRPHREHRPFRADEDRLDRCGPARPDDPGPGDAASRRHAGDQGRDLRTACDHHVPAPADGQPEERLPVLGRDRRQADHVVRRRPDPAFRRPQRGRSARRLRASRAQPFPLNRIET